jgi:thioredoxin 1
MENDSEKKNASSTCGCGGGNCCGGSGKWIWIVLALAIAGVVIVKNAGKKDCLPSTPAATTPTVAPAAAGQATAMPRLVDLGAGKCIPCKMMAPILEDLKKTYAGKLDVQFIDVWDNPEAGKKYGISVIPTQIFYDAAGKELFRHEGFYSRDDILVKWKEFSVDLAN